MRFRKLRAFSILELLIVLAIVGILAGVAIYALGVSRANSRDSKRVSDVAVLRSSLSQYWLQKASYPVNNGVDLGMPGANADGLTSNGFVGPDGGGTVILTRVPVGPSAGEYYHYAGTENGYSLRFTTERDTAYGLKGTYFAHAGGVDQQDVEK